MEPFKGALEYLDQIKDIQNKIDEVNQMECNDKLKLKEECQDKLRWDEQKGRLRRPCITQSQQLLFNERDNLVKSIPDFWAIALFADHGLVRYMNHEEREVFKMYLKSVDVQYHGEAKSGYTIHLAIDENPYFENSLLSKTFTFSRKGISIGSCSEIRWLEDKDIEDFAGKGCTQPSFFKWFEEASEKFNDLIAEEIVMEFWPKAHEYYFTEMDRCARKGTQMLTQERRARKELKGEGKTSKIDISETLSQLRTISDKLRAAQEQATKERHIMEKEHQLELLKGEREVHKKCESLRKCSYKQRNEILKNIHHFWLTAFLSHYALHRLLRKEDQKILKFLNSVYVKETEDEEGVMSGYTITLNFDKNPYFENESLTKKISYTVMSTDPIKQYSDVEVNICVSNINWKDGKDTTVGYPQGFSDSRSFFTWFVDLGCVAMKAYDEVANIIKHDFWPNAGKYFANGNLNDEKEVDLVGISKTKHFTSSRCIFII